MLLLLAGTLLLSSCGLWYETHRLRYVMTVEVMTPLGLRTASSPIEVSVIESPIWDLGRLVNYELRGEAVAIDLPDGRVLFALLRKPENQDWAIHLPIEAFRPFFEQVDRPGAPDWAERIAHLKRSGASATLTHEQLPVFATFERLNEPGSIRRVDADGFAEEFGPGVYLRSVHIAATDEAPRDTLSERLPWLSRYAREGRLLNGTTGSTPVTDVIADRLDASSLSTEAN
jgi:hypothetical protein